MRVHWTLPVGALVFGQGRFVPGFWLGFFLLVLVHELGHAAARAPLPPSGRVDRHPRAGRRVPVVGRSDRDRARAHRVGRRARAGGGATPPRAPRSRLSGPPDGVFTAQLAAAFTTTNVWLIADQPDPGGAAGRRRGVEASGLLARRRATGRGGASRRARRSAAGFAYERESATLERYAGEPARGGEIGRRRRAPAAPRRPEDAAELRPDGPPAPKAPGLSRGLRHRTPTCRFSAPFPISTEKHMLRSSLIGIGLAVAALVAFQVTGCGGSDGGGGAGSTGPRRDDRVAPGRPAAPARAATPAPRAARGRRAAPGRRARRGTAADRHGRDDGRRRDDRQRRDDGHAGTTGGAGTTGAAGTTGTGGTAFGQPPCAGTVTKGGACTADRSSATRPAVRRARASSPRPARPALYVEMDGCCVRPGRHLRLLQAPDGGERRCARPRQPQASQACTVDMCTPCNGTGGLAGGMYLDSSARRRPATASA